MCCPLSDRRNWFRSLQQAACVDDEEGEFNYAQDDKLPIPKRASTYKSQTTSTIHLVSISPGTPTNLPTPTATAVEPTPKASVPSFASCPR